MDFELPGENDPRRLQVRAWCAAHPAPSGMALAQAGYVVPHWPAPWGCEAEPELQIIIDDELRRGRRIQTHVAVRTDLRDDGVRNSRASRVVEARRVRLRTTTRVHGDEPGALRTGHRDVQDDGSGV